MNTFAIDQDSDLRSGRIVSLLLLALFAFIIVVPFSQNEQFYREVQDLFVLGIIGVWRWSVAVTHFLRALFFALVLSPYRRKIARQRGRRPPVLYAVIPSYRMKSEVNTLVYKRFLLDASMVGCPVRVFALVTDPADLIVLDRVFNEVASRLPEGSAIYTLFQDGSGKRKAMADAIRAIAAEEPPAHAQVVLMDGDSVVVPGLLAEVTRYLDAFPDYGAVTVDNDVAVDGHWIVREWYRLRMSQRHVLMSSLAVSKKVLVLTGRFSLFRWGAISSPEFSSALEKDVAFFWRFGNVNMLTGDDKSTWFYLLRNGWMMDYLPNVRVLCLEKLPLENWFRATTALMWRWYGNMIRNTGRAIALGWQKVGLFPWLVLVDQRISPWTTALGPSVVFLLTLSGKTFAIPVYICWVLLSRSFVVILLAIFRGAGHPFQVFLLYYTQVYGAFIKLMILSFPHRQKWARQKIAMKDSGSLDVLGSLWAFTIFVALGTLALFVIFFSYTIDR